MTNPEVIEDVADLPTLVRWRRALRALTRVMIHPEETEQVLVFSNLANAKQREERMHLFLDHPRGKQLYDEQRTLDSHTIDLDALAALPADTLGHAYATFMRAHGLTPDVFDGRPADVRDDRAAYVMQRIRQTHDLWHVVTNAETDPAGEVALQAFTYAQMNAPSSGILAALGTLRSLRFTRDVVRDVRDMYRLGKQAEPLAVFFWEDHWATPLVDVRRMLKLPTHPRPIGGYTAALLEAA
ncbi:MAG TPA: Coq4 family protein [Kofleriaceae bacterium]